MKLQPCFPGFVDGRDAILAADAALTRGENTCLIWDAFARRGLGYSADQGAFFTRFDGTEAFDLPPLCELIAEVDTLRDDGTLNKGQHNSLSKKLLQAQEKIHQGQPDAAINVLLAFIEEVNDLDLSAGFHEVSFEGGHLASGMYFYRIEAGAFVDVKRMVLVK